MTDSTPRARIWVVASEATGRRWTEALGARGYDALSLPFSEVGCLPAEETLRRALDAWVPDRVLLTSKNAVGCLPTGLPTGLPVACVGASTARLAREAGLSVREVGTGSAVDLVEALLGAEPSPRRLLFLRGRDARREAVARLEAAGVSVREVVVYEARARSGFPAAIRSAPRPRAAVVGSPRAAEALLGADRSLRSIPLVAIGGTTARALHDAGAERVFEAPTTDVPGLSAALADLLRTDPSP